jgi:hypothetical protein
MAVQYEAIAKHYEALAQKALDEGEAEKLRAAGEKAHLEGLALEAIARGNAAVIDAEASKVHYEALAKQLEALAYQTELTAKADSAKAAENLRVTKRDNDLLLSTLEIDLKKAELAAKNQLLLQQRIYMSYVGDLNTEVKEQYLILLGQWTTELQTIEDLKEGIALYKLDIDRYKLELATYFIDSTRYVTRFEAKTKASITKDSLSLEYAKRDLALWESFDTGLEGLETEKAEIIEDTVTYSQALADALAELAVLEADTVAKAEALAEVQETYDAAKGVYDAAREVYDAAKENLDKYNKVAGVVTYSLSGSYNYLNSVYEGNWNDIIPTVNISPLTIGNYTYTKELIKTYGSYSYTDYNYPDYSYKYENYYIYDSPNAYVSLTVYTYYIPGTTDVVYYSYQWAYRLYEETVGSVDTKYPTVDVLLTEIKFQKVDTAKKASDFAKAQETLAKSIDSLRIYGDSTYLYETKYEPDAIKALDDAQKVLTAAADAYNKAWDLFIAKPDATKVKADTTNLETLASVYAWKTWDLGTDLPGKGGVTDTSKEKLHNDALDKLGVISARRYVARTKYNNYRINVVRLEIQAVITANDNYNISVKKLTDLEALEDVLKLGTREKLQFALDAADEALTAPVTALTAESALLATANAEYIASINAYDDFATISLVTAQDLYDQAIERYNDVEFIDFQIGLGGIKALLNQKADKLAEILVNIADLEAELALNQLKLEDLAKYALDGSKTVEAVIKQYEKDIADTQKKIDRDEVKIAQAQQKAELYQTAIDVLLKEYESLSE